MSSPQGNPRPPIEVVQPDANWPRWYATEQALVRSALGPALLGIEHIGSTSVPRLAAKPTVDIIAGVVGRAAADRALPALAGLGYSDVTPEDNPDWYYCLGRRDAGRHFHLHLARHESRFWYRHLEFRDFLRSHEAIAREYAELKQELARRWPLERMKYCLAKSGFIRRVEASAGGACIRVLEPADVLPLAEVFEPWNKPVKQFRDYHAEQGRGERVVFIALLNRRPVGYVTVVWRPRYQPFSDAGMPEIVDLNVIAEFRGRSIGSALVYEAEMAAARAGAAVIGISVSQSGEYSVANRLYPLLGFVPDGRGITPEDNELHLTKELLPVDRPATAG
jgi:GrpB-like predicted nucleotidyltransferase (UPF0157 family)/GNAT superfamily N-acetyltransferase